MDCFERSKRSSIMAGIKNRDSKPEVMVRSLLHRMGYRFRKHVCDLPGTPDIVLKSRRKVILVHGCFWHGHRWCARAKLPSTNVQFWSDKIAANRRRDQKNINELTFAGWDVMILWQCELKNRALLETRLKEFIEQDRGITFGGVQERS